MLIRIALISIALTAQGLWAEAMFGVQDDPKIQATGTSVAPQTVAQTAEPNLMENFRCSKGKYTDSTADATLLIKQVLGVPNVQPGKYLVEGAGFQGNRVVIQIRNSPTISMRLISHGADVSGKMCWGTQNGENKIQLAANITGHGKFTITMSNPTHSSRGLHLLGSGELSSVLDFHYDLTDNAPRAGR